MASTRQLLALAGCAFAGYMAWGISEAGNDMTPPPLQSPINIVGGHAEGHRLTLPSWTLDYDRMQSSADGMLVQADGIRDAVIFRKGKPYIHMRADHVQANLATRDFDAAGNVHASQYVHGAWRSFDSAQAHWVDATQLMTMPAHIVVRSKSITVNVDHLTLDAKSGHMHLGRIQGAMHL